MAAPKTPTSDPEIAQVGCPLMILSVMAGLALAVVVSVIAGVPDWGANDSELGGRAIVVVPAALTVTWATWYVAVVLGRVRILRRWAEASLLVIWLVLPAALVLAVLLAPVGRELYDALWFATVAIVVVAVVRAVLDRVRAGPRSVGRQRSPVGRAPARATASASPLDPTAAKAVLDRVAQLRPEEIRALRRAWSAEITIGLRGSSSSPLVEAEATARELAGRGGRATIRAMVREALIKAERGGGLRPPPGPVGRVRGAWRRRMAAPPIEDAVLVAALRDVLPYDAAARLTRAWDAVMTGAGSPAAVEAAARQRYVQRNRTASLALIASIPLLALVVFAMNAAGADRATRELLLAVVGVAWFAAAGALLLWRRREERRLRGSD